MLAMRLSSRWCGAAELELGPGIDLDSGRVGVAVMASSTSTALRYAQQDSAHSGQGPVWIWQRRFFAWKTREWWGCWTGTALLVLSALAFEAGGVWEGSEGPDEDRDEGEGGETRAGLCFGAEKEREERERAGGMDDGATAAEGGARFSLPLPLELHLRDKDSERLLLAHLPSVVAARWTGGRGISSEGPRDGC